MIEINLLPTELKSRLKDSEAAPPIFVYFIPLVFVVLIIIHTVLGGMYLSQSIRLKALQGTWSKFEKQQKELESFKQQLSLLSKDAQGVSDLEHKRIDWSEKMYQLSACLPPGVWFTQLQVKETGFILNGSVVSLQKTELAVINKYVDTLKADVRFKKDFSTLALGPLIRRTVGGYEIVDFILTGTLIPQ